MNGSPCSRRRVVNPSRLKVARERAGLTQLQLSIRLAEREVTRRVQREVVHQWERGDRVPRSTILANIADILGVPLDSLFREEEVA
ncbi:MAG: helix-turn-helix domain-containing protein [Actinobacteria bacterium]|nr:helix-turn-helix domain-containing protein [Actinomycetota bacterium]